MGEVRKAGVWNKLVVSGLGGWGYGVHMSEETDPGGEEKSS